MGEVDVHGVDLLHQRQLRRLALPDQRTLGHQRAANAAGDGRGDGGVTHIDLRGLDGCLGSGHVGLGQLLCGDSRNQVLLAHGMRRGQRLVALGLGLRRSQVGFGPGQAGLGAGQGGLVGRGVNLEQGLVSPHFGAFGELPALQNTGHAGPHLGHARGFRTARQFGYQADRTARHGHHAHLGWRGRLTRNCRWRGCRLSTSGQQASCAK